MDKLVEHKFSFDKLAIAAGSSSHNLITNATISSELLVNGSSSTHPEIMDKLSFEDLTLAAGSSSHNLTKKEKFERTDNLDLFKRGLFYVTITLLLFLIACFFLITVRCSRSRGNLCPIFNRRPDSVYQ